MQTNTLSSRPSRPAARRALPIVFAVMAALLIGAVRPASATTWTVTNLNDTGTGSLRTAVTSAANGDTITFTPGLTGTIILASGYIDITKSINIDGPGSDVLAISGPYDGALLVSAGTVVSISNLMFTGCTVVNGTGNRYNGSAISSVGSLTVSNCWFSNNAATDGNGGAIEVQNGSATIQYSTFEANGSSGNGGAIDVEDNGSVVTINASTFTNNQAGGNGGGLELNDSGDIATVVNSTFTNNSAGNGGAISGDNGTLTLINSTLVSNSAHGQGAGVYVIWSDISISSSLIAKNSSSDMIDVGNYEFEGGTYTSGGSNFIGTTNSANFTGPHDQVGKGDPHVATLANNGGPTPTIALLPGSPAIDADYNQLVNVDQRGVKRPQGIRNCIGAFEYVPAASPVPIVNSFTPTSGPVGTTVTITGLGFTGATAVSFNGVASTSVTVASDSILVATVPTGATTGPISVEGPGGTGISAGSFTVTTPAPKITSFTPSSGPVGGQVAISGSGFTGATSVTFNGTAATTFSVLADTVIIANVPKGATTGKIDVVTPGGTAASATSFSVVAAPNIVSLTPSSGPVGTVVAISGSGFTGTTAVRFGGVSTPSFSVLSDTVLIATVPTGATTGVVSVTAPGGTGISPGSYTVGYASPVISGFTPGSGTVGALVAIFGSGFTGTTSVTFGGVQSPSVTLVSDSVVLATVPAGAQTGAISVTARGGTATSTSTFTIPASVPAITGFSPASGPVGTPVVISGTGLSGVTSVKFATAAATSVTVVSDNAIIAVVPVGAATGVITVATHGGTIASATSFTVTTVVPTITSFTPSLGPVGTQVIISGTGLASATSVKFNTTAATAVTRVSNAVLLATVPTGATTGLITIVTPGGTATSSTSYTVADVAPTIASFSPGSGPVGTTVVISGANFTGATAVKFNATAATFKVESGSVIVATVPAAATTGKISVTTPGGTATSSGSYTILATASVRVDAVSVVGAQAVISGAGFTGAKSVSFDGVPAPSVTVVSDNVIVASVPSGAKASDATVK